MLSLISANVAFQRRLTTKPRSNNIPSAFSSFQEILLPFIRKLITRRIALSIYERIGLLAKYPEFGRTGRLPETRELVFAGLPYLAIYRITEESIEVLRILHGAQDWP